jgi:hypothetical protein
MMTSFPLAERMVVMYIWRNLMGLIDPSYFSSRLAQNLASQAITRSSRAKAMHPPPKVRSPNAFGYLYDTQGWGGGACTVLN